MDRREIARSERAMNVPGLGQVTKDDETGWLLSEPVPVRMFGGTLCRIVLEGYDFDDRKEQYHAAIANFLAGTQSVLRAADEPLFRYYRDFEEWWRSNGTASTKSTEDLWRHVQLGNQPMVTRNRYGDNEVYVSVQCECDWEPEHGLQLVLKNGLHVTKLGGFDGHLTNADAYGDDRLKDVVYARAADL